MFIIFELEKSVPEVEFDACVQVVVVFNETYEDRETLIVHTPDQNA